MDNSLAREGKKTKPPVIVKPVLNAIRILRFLSALDRPATVTTISRELKINTSTCFNILRTLVSADVLQFQSDTKTYSISSGAIALGGNPVLGGGITSAIQSSMESLAYRFGITLGLWRRVGDERLLLVWLVESPTSVRIMLKLGQRLPLLIGAAGRVVAAFDDFPEDEIARRFPQLRWHAPISISQYLEEVEETRQQGYSIDNGVFVKGALGIAAPVFEKDGTIRSIISSTSFAGQHDDKEVRKIASELKSLGNQISVLLATN